MTLLLAQQIFVTLAGLGASAGIIDVTRVCRRATREMLACRATESQLSS